MKLYCIKSIINAFLISICPCQSFGKPREVILYTMNDLNWMSLSRLQEGDLCRKEKEDKQSDCFSNLVAYSIQDFHAVRKDHSWFSEDLLERECEHHLEKLLHSLIVGMTRSCLKSPSYWRAPAFTSSLFSFGDIVMSASLRSLEPGHRGGNLHL